MAKTKLVRAPLGIYDVYEGPCMICGRTDELLSEDSLDSVIKCSTCYWKGLTLNTAG